MALQWYNLKLPDGRVKEVWCDPEDPKTSKGLNRLSKEGIPALMEARLDRMTAAEKQRQAEQNSPKEQET